MTCEEYLRTLETGPVKAVTQTAPAREHLARCPDCSWSTTLVAEGERDLGARRDNAASAVSPLQTAETAMVIAARQRTAKFVRWGLAALSAVVAWLIWMQVILPSIHATAALTQDNLRTETIRLSCLTSQQAGDLVSPYLRSNGSLYYVSKPPLNVITIRATPAELTRAEVLLRNFDAADASKCGAAPK